MQSNTIPIVIGKYDASVFIYLFALIAFLQLQILLSWPALQDIVLEHIPRPLFTNVAVLAGILLIGQWIIWIGFILFRVKSLAAAEYSVSKLFLIGLTAYMALSVAAATPSATAASLANTLSGLILLMEIFRFAAWRYSKIK